MNLRISSNPNELMLFWSLFGEVLSSLVWCKLIAIFLQVKVIVSVSLYYIDLYR